MMRKLTFTDLVLFFMATENYGVREAIATAQEIYPWLLVLYERQSHRGVFQL